jgi:hypothetical protein
MRARDRLAMHLRGLPVDEDTAVIFLLGFLAEEGCLSCGLEEFVEAGEGFRDKVAMTKGLWLATVSALVDANTDGSGQQDKLDRYLASQAAAYRQRLDEQTASRPSSSGTP